MPFNLFGSVIGSMVNAYSTERTNQMNRQIAQDQMQWQQQENERAFQRDLQIWDMQNQYNSPAAQRERIEAAGGNAMLAFGNGVNVSSGNSTSAPSYTPAKAITPNLTPYQGWNLGTESLLDNLMKLKLFKGQQDMQDADVGIKQQEQRRLGILNDILDGTKQYQIEQSKETAKKLANENAFFEETKEFLKGKLENEVNLTDKQVKHLDALIGKLLFCLLLVNRRNLLRHLRLGNVIFSCHIGYPLPSISF